MRGRVRRTQVPASGLNLRSAMVTVWPKRLNPEKGSETELLVAGMWTEEKDVHGWRPYGSIQYRGKY